MDELTRERFWPRPLPPPTPAKPVEDIVGRQLLLIGIDEENAKQVEQVREIKRRAEALLRSRKLSRAIMAYEVKRG